MLTYLFAAIAVLAIAVPVCGASAHTSGILLLLQAVGDAALGIKAKGVLNGTDLNGCVSIVNIGHNFIFFWDCFPTFSSLHLQSV